MAASVPDIMDGPVCVCVCACVRARVRACMHTCPYVSYLFHSNSDCLRRLMYWSCKVSRIASRHGREMRSKEDGEPDTTVCVLQRFCGWPTLRPLLCRQAVCMKFESSTTLRTSIIIFMTWARVHIQNEQWLHDGRRERVNRWERRRRVALRMESALSVRSVCTKQCKPCRGQGWERRERNKKCWEVLLSLKRLFKPNYRRYKTGRAFVVVCFAHCMEQITSSEANGRRFGQFMCSLFNHCYCIGLHSVQWSSGTEKLTGKDVEGGGEGTVVPMLN
jgi:hypothetical protein